MGSCKVTRGLYAITETWAALGEAREGVILGNTYMILPLPPI